MKRIYRLLLSLILSIILVFSIPAVFLIVLFYKLTPNYNNAKSITVGDYTLDIQPSEHYPELELNDSCLIVITRSHYPEQKDTLVYHSLEYAPCPIGFFIGDNDEWTIVGDSVYYYITNNMLSIQKLSYYDFTSLYKIPAQDMFLGRCDTVTSFNYAYMLYDGDSYIIDYKNDFSSLYRRVYSSERKYDKKISLSRRRKHKRGFYANDSLSINWEKDIEYYYARIENRNRHKTDTIIWEGGPMTVVLSEDTIYVATIPNRYIYQGCKNNSKLERLYFYRGYKLPSEKNDSSYRRIKVDFYYSSRQPSRPIISVNPVPAQECTIPLPDYKRW